MIGEKPRMDAIKTAVALAVVLAALLGPASCATQCIGDDGKPVDW